MAISKKLMDTLASRREKILASGGADKLARRHEKGLLSARERLEVFFDEGTFQEFGMYVTQNFNVFEGANAKESPADGVITGIGLVDGRPVAAYSQDFMVSGGSLGANHAEKICKIAKFAGENGMPVVGVNDSGGARIQEAVEALAGYSKIFWSNVNLSGVVPQIAIIAGPCAGGAAYSPALMDFIIMTKQNSQLFICGPQVIAAATGEKADPDSFASAAAHASISGNIHLVANDDRHALELSKKLLSYLPSNNTQDAPHDLNAAISKPYDAEMNDIVPEDSKNPLDVYKVINRLVDADSFFELQAMWAKNIVIGFARIEGVVVGIIANQPAFKAGCLDINASDKSSRFIRTCNAYNIPIVNLVDVPGFMPGLAQEQGGIIRHGAKMLFAYASATVPKITLIMRKAYGGAYIGMCNLEMGADMVFAWPTAEIAVMGAEGAINILFKKDIEAATDPKAKAEELKEFYRDKFANPYQAASKGMVTDVIEPAQTRGAIASALRLTLNKRQTRLPKKHGNIPL